MILRIASFDGGEVTLWVNHYTFSMSRDVRFSPVSDQIAELRKPMHGLPPP